MTVKRGWVALSVEELIERDRQRRAGRPRCSVVLADRSQCGEAEGHDGPHIGSWEGWPAR